MCCKSKVVVFVFLLQELKFGINPSKWVLVFPNLGIGQKMEEVEVKVGIPEGKRSVGP